jgi:hypothetical protein
MNKPITANSVSRADGGTIAQLSRPRIFALEEADDFSALRAAHIRELAPRTPYEQSLAEALVGYEWEMARMSRFRDSAMMVMYRRLALRTLKSGDPAAHSFDDIATDDDHRLAEALLQADLETRLSAEREFLERTGWEPGDLQALAYAQASGVSMFEARIADLERRRRVLRDDYARLQATRSTLQIEDAEVVDDVVVEAKRGN